MLAANLGILLGLPITRVEVIEVPDWLIEHSPELRFQLAGQQLMPKKREALGIVLHRPERSRLDVRLVAK